MNVHWELDDGRNSDLTFSANRLFIYLFITNKAAVNKNKTYKVYTQTHKYTSR